jgi:aspartyl/asparaginyl beta-hydroxylase (cupin superfamily)
MKLEVGDMHSPVKTRKSFDAHQNTTCFFCDNEDPAMTGPLHRASTFTIDIADQTFNS